MTMICAPKWNMGSPTRNIHDRTTMVLLCDWAVAAYSADYCHHGLLDGPSPTEGYAPPWHGPADQ